MTKPFLGTPRKRPKPQVVPVVQQTNLAPGAVVSPITGVAPVFTGAPTAVPAPLIPAVPVNMLNPFYFLSLIRPAVEHGLREAQSSGVRHAMIEVALCSILMAMGFDFRTALAIVESWEINNAFPGEELFREEVAGEYESE